MDAEILAATAGSLQLDVGASPVKLLGRNIVFDDCKAVAVNIGRLRGSRGVHSRKP